MAILKTYDGVTLKVGEHYFREDRTNSRLSLGDPQELVCTKILKGSADFTTINYEEGEDEQGFYINGEKFHFDNKYISNHLHSTKKRAIQASILTIECEIINLMKITAGLEKLIETHCKD